MHSVSPSRWIAVLAVLLALALAGCRPVQPVGQAGASAQAPAASAAATAVPTVVPEAATGKVAADWTPPPLSPNVTVYFDGLEYPRGLKFDADGSLYVAEAGNSGDRKVTNDTCSDFDSPFMPYFMGDTSRVSKITADGKRTTVIDKIPSSRDSYDWVYGATDVALMDGQVYTLIESGGCSRGLDDVPNGILRGNGDGTWTVFGDLSKVLHANWPPNPKAEDMEIDGYPYGLISAGDKFYIVETNHGGLYEVDKAGKITKLVNFNDLFGHIAPSVLTYYDGNIYVGNIGMLPTKAGTSKVFKISPQGKVETYAEGLTNILGLAFDDQGRLYVLEMSNGETETPALGTGRVVRINKDGLRDIMATGLSMPAGITFGPDGALYASQYAYDLEPGRPHAGKGQVVRIDVRQPVASRR